MVDKNYILNYYKNKLTDDESLKYLTIHAKRYALLLEIIFNTRNTIKSDRISIIDIGPSFLTEQIQFFLKNDTIYNFGFSHPESRGGHLPGEVKINNTMSIHFDLNNAQNKEKWITVPKSKIVIMAEVVEHLYTAPQIVLNFIRTFLDKNGILIVQTPNAVSLFKRMSILCGKNPFDMIRENNQNPGHYREYTKNELFSIAATCNFKVLDFLYSNYFDLQPFNYKATIYRLLQYILGKSFYDGMTILLQKEE